MNKNAEKLTRIQENVNRIIMDQLQVSKDLVTPESTIIDDLGADSLDIVELIMALEEEFNIEIPDEVAEKMIPCTVGDVYELVLKAVQE